MSARISHIPARPLRALLVIAGLALACGPVIAASLNAAAISKAAGVAAKTQPDGVVKIAWSRSDVSVTVDGMRLPPVAGLGSWAAFSPMGSNQAMVMGDTVVFQDEVDAAMDAAFAHGLHITGLHNHFFYDQPKVYFMHIEGEDSATALASDVKAVWDAIKAVRAAGRNRRTASVVPGRQRARLIRRCSPRSWVIRRSPTAAHRRSPSAPRAVRTTNPSALRWV